MKGVKFVCMLLAICMLASLAGCGAQDAGKTGASDAANAYMEKAQKYVDENNYAVAIDILQLGVDTLGEEALKEMLADVIALQTGGDQAEVGIDLAAYDGTWATEGTGWVYGGLILDVYTLENEILLELTFHQSAPASRVAAASGNVLLSEMDGNRAKFFFDNDGWGNTGTVEVIFLDGEICVDIADMTCDPYAMWGFYENRYYLGPNGAAHEAMNYDMDEYYAVFPEEAPPVYDASKASGI